MMLYALGALRLFDSLCDITEISMSIYQPRGANSNRASWSFSSARARHLTAALQNWHHTDGYVEFVLEQLTQAKLECADPLVLIEVPAPGRCTHRGFAPPAQPGPPPA